MMKQSCIGTTLHFGELYEVRAGAGTIHLFANNKRVASVFLDGTSQFYHTNHLGSSSVITNQIGEKKEQIEYFPYGTYRSPGNINGTYDFDVSFPDVFYTFTGQEDDDDLGLYNYGARLYDPLLGKFISPDPYMSPNLALSSTLNGNAQNYESIRFTNTVKPYYVRRFLSLPGTFWYEGISALQFYNPIGLGLNSDKREQNPNIPLRDFEQIDFFENPQELNRYSYGLNNPLYYTDPTGMKNWGTAFTNALNDVFGFTADVIGMATDTSGTYGYYGGAIGGAVGGVLGGVLGGPWGLHVGSGLQNRKL